LARLEWLPKSDRYKEWKTLTSAFGHYIPNAELRPFAENSWACQPPVRHCRTAQIVHASAMRYAMPHFPLELEIPDEWLTEAGS
jgi:hypothetical protein